MSPVVATVPVGLATSFGVTAPNGVFTLSVAATNAAGTGPESVTPTVTVPSVVAAPGAPRSLAVSVSGSTAAFAWTPPASGGPAAGDTLLAGTSPGFGAPLATLPLPANPRALTLAGIRPGTCYVRLVATNPGGSSPAPNEVTVAAVRVTVPAAPVLNTPMVSGHSATWSGIAGAGGTPTGCTLRASATPRARRSRRPRSAAPPPASAASRAGRTTCG